MVEPLNSPARKRQRALSGSSVEEDLKPIILTREEGELVDVLKNTVTRYNVKTQVRIAGGWVRDKLLGRNSNDIDVALDDMTGEAFANLVNNYLKESGQKPHKIGIIFANPEQSKHLETATINILGFDVDFVNLRSEIYHDISRIPAFTGFGTALEDAERRDFTINSLFYNVSEGCLEDLTGKGIEDLKKGVIRTPLPPARTFKDDPLRMLRALRFASRFRFKLDKSVEEALRSSENMDSLAFKISRERIGTELSAMLRGPYPQGSLELLNEFNMMPLIFTNPENPPVANSKSKGDSETKLNTEMYERCKKVLSEANWKQRTELAGSLKKAIDSDLFGSKSPAQKLEPEFVPLLALLHGFETTTGINSKLKPEPLTVLILRDSLKFRSGLAFQLKAISSAVDPILILSASSDSIETRRNTGRLIYDLQEHFYIALALTVTINPEKHEQINSFFQNVIGSWGFSNLWTQPMIFNGKELIEAVGFPKAGPYVGHMMSLQRDWVIANLPTPEISETERRKKCQEYLLSLKDRVLQDEENRQNRQKLEKEEETKKRKEAKELARLERERAEAAKNAEQDKLKTA